MQLNFLPYNFSRQSIKRKVTSYFLSPHFLTGGSSKTQRLTQDAVQLSLRRNPIEELYEFQKKFGHFMSDYRCALMAKEEFRMFENRTGRSSNPIEDYSIRDYLLEDKQRYKNINDNSTSRMEEILKEYDWQKTPEEKEKLLKEFETLCNETLSRKQEFIKLKNKLAQLYMESCASLRNTPKGMLKPAREIENASELVRMPEDAQKIPREYVENSQDVRSYLNFAIDSGNYTDSYESYVKTMNTAHQLAYFGKNGNSLYYKKHGKAYTMEAGKWRTSNIKHGREPNMNYFGISIKDIAQKYNDPLKDIIALGKQSKTSRVRLKNIPKQYQPVDIWKYSEFEGINWFDGYEHVYPPTVSLDLYHREMYRSAKEVIKRIKNGESKRRILESIAEHYQYAVNARSYEQINNSLYMNEVNTLLQRAGMKAMPHGALDLIAQRLQPESFKKYFIDTYRKTSLPDFNINKEILIVHEG